MNRNNVRANEWSARISSEYLEWMVSHRDSSSDSLIKHRRYLALFLTHLATVLHKHRLRDVTHGDVEAFFLNYASAHGKPSREQMQSVLRVFLRFCWVKRYIKRDLSIAVPTLHSYRLASLPDAVTEGDISRILDGIDMNVRGGRAGRRDFAIFTMLRAYGVRSKQIRTLKLTDIDWRQNEIYFAQMKGGKQVVLPLTREVGESLLDYLQNGRPDIETPEVFLTSQRPFLPLRCPSTVSSLVARRARHTGVALPKWGPHVFRHAFASRMVNTGHSLKEVADLLGHRRIQTTYIYTKVDFQHLNEVALKWPEVTP